MVIPGRGRIAGKVEDVRQIVPLGELHRLEIQNRRHEHDAIEGDPAFDQIARKARGARGSVAFAHQKQRRCPALITGQVQADELTHRLDIAVDAPEFLPQLRFCRAAVARAHRIDEHKVGLIEPRVLVVHQMERRSGHAAIRQHHHAFGPNGAQMQPHRRGTRPAIEGEHQRTAAGVANAVERIRDEKDVGFDVALGVLQRHQAGGHRILQRLSANMDLVVSDHGRFFFIGFLEWFGVGRFRFGRLRIWSLSGGRRSLREQ